MKLKIEQAKQPCNILSLLSGMLICLAINACKKNDLAFYEDIDNVQIIPSPEISVRGTVRNISLSSIDLFVPDGTTAGAYAYGSTVRLDDSTLMIACTRYLPDGFDDFQHADIIVRKSTDNGATWGEELLLQPNIGIVNTLAPNLLLLEKNHLILIFGVKNSNKEIALFIKESFDNAITWTEPRKINNDSNIYYALVNDRVIYNNGRILLPVAFALDIYRDYDKQVICCFYSDDKGRTWRKSNLLKSGFALMEPSITSISDNSLLMTIRSKEGVIYFSKSNDNGKTWINIYKTNIETPEAPQVITRLHKSDTLLMIWNNAPYSPGHNNRTPLTFAYSTDKGETWLNPVNLQNNTNNNYFYPSLFVDRNDTIHVTYGVRAKTEARSMLLYDKLSLKELIQ